MQPSPDTGFSIGAPSQPGHRGETVATVRWERATYWPLTIAALAFMLVYTFQVIGDLDGPWSVVCSAVIVATWVMFIGDYVVRLAMSRPRATWARRHPFDAAVVLIPAFRPVRLLGALVRVLSHQRSEGSSVRAALLVYGAGSTLLLIWQSSLTVLQVERHAPGANITGFGDAVWWAFCTVTTVGYGDYAPVTVQGRVVAVFLMIGGVVLVGLVVASFSSWVMERAARGHEDQLPATRAEVQSVLDAVSRPGAVSPDDRPAG